MKKICIILLFILLFSCNKESQDSNLLPPFVKMNKKFYLNHIQNYEGHWSRSIYPYDCESRGYLIFKNDKTFERVNYDFGRTPNCNINENISGTYTYSGFDSSWNHGQIILHYKDSSGNQVTEILTNVNYLYVQLGTYEYNLSYDLNGTNFGYAD